MGNNESTSKSTAPKVNPVTELQTYIMIVQAKLTQNRNKKVEMIKKKRKEIVSCLEDNNLDIAKAKMDSLIREEDFITVFDILGPLCEILKEKVSFVMMSDKCPDDLRAALDTMVFASSRLEIDELHKVRGLISKKFGEIYVKKALDNADNLCNINVVEKLKIKQAADQYVVARLKQLTKEEKMEFEFPQDIIPLQANSFEPMHNQIDNQCDFNPNYINQGMNFNQYPNNNFQQPRPDVIGQNNYNPNVPNFNSIPMSNIHPQPGFNTIPMSNNNPQPNFPMNTVQPNLGINNQYGYVQTTNPYGGNSNMSNVNQMSQPNNLYPNQSQQINPNYNNSQMNPGNNYNQYTPNLSQMNHESNYTQQYHPQNAQIQPGVPYNQNMNYGMPSRESVIDGGKPVIGRPQIRLENIDEVNLGTSYVDSPKNNQNVTGTPGNNINQSNFQVLNKNESNIRPNNNFNMSQKNPSISDKTFVNVETPGNESQKSSIVPDHFPKVNVSEIVHPNNNVAGSTIDDLFPNVHNSTNFPRK